MRTFVHYMLHLVLGQGGSQVCVGTDTIVVDTVQCLVNGRR
jgi:hypothetical protein